MSSLTPLRRICAPGKRQRPLLVVVGLLLLLLRPKLSFAGAIPQQQRRPHFAAPIPDWPPRVYSRAGCGDFNAAAAAARSWNLKTMTTVGFKPYQGWELCVLYYCRFHAHILIIFIASSRQNVSSFINSSLINLPVLKYPQRAREEQPLCVQCDFVYVYLA